MLGMYIVLENYLQMVCDYPEAYEGQPGFEFIQQIPTTWDETKVVTAELNEYICIARRNGKNWYIGAINSSKQKEINIPMNFLPAGNYKATMFTDSPATVNDPNILLKHEKIISNKDSLTISLAAGGGAAMIISSE